MSEDSRAFVDAQRRQRLWRRFLGYALAQSVLLVLLAFFLVFVFVSSVQGFASLLILWAAALVGCLRWAWVYASLRTELELLQRAQEGLA